MNRSLSFPRSRMLLLPLLAGAAILVTTGCNPIRQMKIDKEMLEARVMQLEQDRESVEAAARSASERALEAMAEVDRLKAENERLALQVAAANRMLGDANKQQAEATALEMEQRLARENEMRLRVEQLEADLEIRGNELAMASSDLQQARTEMEGLRTRIAEMTRTLELKTEEGRSLRAERDDARAERDDFRRQLTSLQTDKDEAAKQLEELSTKVRDQEKELAAIGRELEEARASLAEQERARVSSADARTALAGSLRRALDPQIRAGAASVEERDGDIHVSVLNDALYQQGTVLLSPEGERLLTALAQTLRGAPLRAIAVEGHTDNVPLANMPYQDNWDLGAARALAVTRHLAYGDDVPARVLSASSRAFFSPVAPNDTPENRRKNRRVEMVIQLEE
jgi:chemotaxis protein MotB